MGKREDVQRLLTAAYASFTEGLDTQDLRDAHSLLQECA